ncbi:MAG: hypothetical protein JOZ58_06925 [Acetobacteraceae bacterium]|nr:hypothetical protein [Acetobacteraceae bacterium]MBV8574758.1 hypothetical protein [Acetobacteraceae bacterium]
MALHYMDAVCTPLALAGLWEGYRNEDGSVLRSFAVITTDANTDLASLARPDVGDCREAGLAGLTWHGGRRPAPLLHPAHERALRVWPVDEWVSKPDQNGPDLLCPLRA